MNKKFKKHALNSELRRVVTGFTMWKYVKAITTPFTSTKAYKLGIIDASGGYLKNPNKLSSTERKALTAFDIMIFNLKQLFTKIVDPNIKVKLKYIPTAIPLLAEEAARYGANESEICEGLLLYLYEHNIEIENLEEDPNLTLEEIDENVDETSHFNDFIDDICHLLKEEGESGGIINSVGAGGIAGLGDDARAGNVVVRKRHPIFRRKRRRE